MMHELFELGEHYIADADEGKTNAPASSSAVGQWTPRRDRTSPPNASI